MTKKLLFVLTLLLSTFATLNVALACGGNLTYQPPVPRALRQG